MVIRMKIIELSDVTFGYDEAEPPVLAHFNLAIEKGTCIVIEGDNGSGKTTLFRIINGLSFPQKGKFLFDGTEITEKYLKDSRNAKLFHKRIGYLFQNPDVMLFNAKVYDEIAFGPRQMGMAEEEVKRRTQDCMRIFDLEALADKAPYHLSGGQKKKTALAAVMSLNPEVIVLDEPFAGLDQKSQQILTTFIEDLKKAGKTLLIATHNPDVKEKLADVTISL